MASEVTREIDANFAIPEGLKDTTVRDPFEDINPVTFDEADIDVQVESYDEETSEISTDEVNDDIATPEAIEIISQDVRTAPDGRQVIDIVIEVTDVDGATGYDVRVTKLEEEI